MKIEDLKGKKQERSQSFEVREINEETRTISLAFSSETAVERWFGREILDHSTGSIRLDRLRDGAPLLLQHSPGEQIGVVESVEIGSDRKGRATVKLSRGPLGEEIFRDIQDGIRRNVSVGYMVHEMRLEEQADDIDTYRVTDWEPMEISMVSIPADTAAQVGRSADPQPLMEGSNMPDEIRTEEEHQADDTLMNTEERATEVPVAAEPVVDRNPIDARIREIGARFEMVREAEDYISLDASVEEFQTAVRKAKSERLVPGPSVPSNTRVEMRVPMAGATLRSFTPELYGGSRPQAEEAAYRAGMWALAEVFGDKRAAKWCKDYGVRVMTGQSNNSSIVPDEMVLPIISLREQYGIARQHCYVHPMSGDTATVPRDSADVTAYFVGRETANTESNPEFDNINLTAREVSAESRVSNSYAEDTAINLADHLVEKQARAFAVKEDGCLFNGDGTSTYGGIQGIRTKILGLAGAIDAASGHDTFAEITAVDLRKVMGAIQDVPGLMANWFTSRPGKANMFGRLKDAAGGNSKNNLSEGEADTWAGYDIITSPAMPKVLTDLSDVAMAIFGDLRMGVIFGDRRGIELMVDPYSLSSYRQTKIISTERFDINVHGVGDATNAGPIVALIGE